MTPVCQVLQVKPTAVLPAGQGNVPGQVCPHTESLLCEATTGERWQGGHLFGWRTSKTSWYNPGGTCRLAAASLHPEYRHSGERGWPEGGQAGGGPRSLHKVTRGPVCVSWPCPRGHCIDCQEEHSEEWLKERLLGQAEVALLILVLILGGLLPIKQVHSLCVDSQAV